jgi:adenylate cyclase
MFEKAIELDPKYSTSYTDLGSTYWLDWVLQWSDDPSALDRALQLEQQAIALDDSQPMAHTQLSSIYLFKKQYDQAATEAKRTLALDPNFTVGYTALAQVMVFSGKPAEVIGLEEKAIRLDPRNRDYYVFWEAMAYTLMGRYAEAIPLLKQHFTRYPNDLGSHVVLIIDYIELGHEQEARAEAAEVLRISPHFSLDMWRQRSPQKNRALLERNLGALRKAGLK